LESSHNDIPLTDKNLDWDVLAYDNVQSGTSYISTLKIKV